VHWICSDGKRNEEKLRGFGAKGREEIKAATSSPPALSLYPSLSLSKAKNGEEDRRKAGAVCIASLDAVSMAPN